MGKMQNKQGCRRSQLYRHLLGIASAVLGLLILVLSPTQSMAQSTMGEGVKGWFASGPNTYHSSADTACRARFDYYKSTSPNRYVGSYPTDHVNIVDCSWTYVAFLCLPENGYSPTSISGNLACSIPAPGPVDFQCDTGYKVAAASTPQCVKEIDYVETRRICTYDNGAGINPPVGNPIVLRSGEKVESATDFATADNRFSLTRNYRSFYGSAKVDSAASAFGNWRFGLLPEIRLDVYDVTLHMPDGSAHDFKIQSDGSVPASGTNPTREYTVRFLGTAPSYDGTYPTDKTTLSNFKTRWEVKDAESRTWVLETFPSLNTNASATRYKVARPVSMTERDGYTQTYTYSSTDSRLLSISDSFGRTASFTWSYLYITALSGIANTTPIPQTITGVTLPDGTSLRYTYDPAVSTAVPSTSQPERLVKVERLNSSNAVIDSTAYHYEDTRFRSHLTGMTDHRGVRVGTYAYDARGRGISTQGAGGTNTYTIAYEEPSATETVRRVTNPLGKQTLYRFTRSGGTYAPKINLTKIEGQASTNCPASTGTYAYTGDSITSYTDEEGRVTTYTRDSRGRALTMTRGSGTASAVTTTTTWHPSLNVPTKIVEPNLTTDFVYNTLGKLTSLTQTDTTTQTVPYSTNGRTRTWVYTYGTGGVVTSVDGPLAGTGDRVAYTYNTQGYLATTTNEVGHITRVVAWNGRGQPTDVRDANNVRTTYNYDALGRLSYIIVNPGADQASWVFSYTAASDVASLTEPSGRVLTFTYDSARRLTKMSNNLGESVEYTRDALGGATSTVTKANGGAVAFSMANTFDELGRLIKQVGGETRTNTFTFDKTDNLTSVKDPRSNTISYGYDSLSRLIRTTERDGGVVNLTRNAQDDITNYQDPRSISTTYVRNGFGEVIREISKDRAAATDYDYDARGLMTRQTDGRSIVTTFAYDNAGRMLTRTTSVSAENIGFSYDVGTFGKGRMTGMTDASGTTAWVYDAKGNVLSETRVIAGRTYTVTYAYNAVGQRISITYPSGKIVLYGYDSQGRVNSVKLKRSAAAAEEVIASGVTYQPFGEEITGLTFGNGLALSQTFDKEQKIKQIRLANGASSVMNRVHAMSDGLNITGFSEVNTAENQTFTYDPAERLLSATGPYGSLSWVYDLASNRTREVRGGVTTLYTYPADKNRLGNTRIGSVFQRQFVYDGAGNTTQDTRGSTVYAFGYDQHNRMKQVTVAGVVKGNYTYDGRNRLAIRQVLNSTPSGTSHFIHDLNNQILAESTSTGAPIREYIWLGDLPIAVLDSTTATTNLFFAHADHLKRPILLTNSSKAVVWKAIYEPFGTVHSITGAATLDMRFPGQWFMLETGLAYNWHRLYDSTIGRYTQADPLNVLTVGSNLYGYANQNPLKWIDPDGRNPVAGCIIGGSVGGPIGCGIGATTVVVGTICTGAVIYGIDWYRNYNKKGDEEIKYPENPEDYPEKFRKIRGTPASENLDDGSVWEPNKGRGHGGDQWKRWPNKKSWQDRDTPNSIWPDGRQRK
jgi:RHS repeat-associated protein